MIAIEEHAGLIEVLLIRIIRRFGPRLAYKNCTVEDLRQSGWLALCKAAAGFDPEHGVQFSTYAWKSIWREMVRAIVHGSLIRATRDGEQARKARDWCSYDTYGGDEHGESFAALIPAPESPSTTEYDDWWEVTLRSLPEKWKRVILMYLREGMTYKEIGLYLKVSKEAVRQMLERAIARLARQLRWEDVVCCP